jgi:hypothetical protein
MPSVRITVQTQYAMSFAEAAHFCLSLWIIREGLMTEHEMFGLISSHIENNVTWKKDFLRSPRVPEMPAEFLRSLGRNIDNPTGFLPLHAGEFAGEAANDIIGSIFEAYRQPLFSSGIGPQFLGPELISLRKGTIESVIRDIFSWFGDVFSKVLNSARGLIDGNPDEFYKALKSIELPPSNSPLRPDRLLGRGLTVVGAFGFQQSLEALGATDLTAENLGD